MKLATTSLTAMALVLAAPALAQETDETAGAGDALVVELTEDGPVITDQKAASPEALTEQLEADIIEPMEPVIRDGDQAVLEPLVMKSDVMPVSDDIAAPAQASMTSDDLNARALEAVQDAAPLSETSGEDMNDMADNIDATAEEAAAEAVADTAADAEEVVGHMEDMEAGETEAEMDIASEVGGDASLTEPAEEMETALEEAEAASEEAQEAADAVADGDAAPEAAAVEEDSAGMAAAADAPTDLRARIEEAEGDGAVASETDEVEETVAEIETASEMIDEAAEELAETSAEGIASGTSARITMITIGETTDEVEIEASGRNITTTLTPDGSTRLIRIEPAEGQSGGATLITITKD